MVARREDAGDYARTGQGEESAAEDRGFIAGRHAGVWVEMIVGGGREAGLGVEGCGEGGGEQGEWGEEMAQQHCVWVDEIGR